MRVGCDIVENARIKALVLKHQVHLIGRVFTQLEWDYCSRQKNPYPSFAVRFAAKEAVAKALGVGIGKSLKWISVEIIRDALGMPHVKLDNLGQDLLKICGGNGIQISLSHSREYALAVAVIDKN